MRSMKLEVPKAKNEISFANFMEKTTDGMVPALFHPHNTHNVCTP